MSITVLSFAAGCGASPPDVTGHWKRVGLDGYLSIVERGDELVAEIRESDMRGGYGTTRYQVEWEGDRVFITLPYEGQVPVLLDDESGTLDMAGERYERVSDAEAKQAFERFEEVNEALAADKTRCNELQRELSTKLSERVEGDEKVWNAYLDEVAAVKPQGCTLVGDERGVGRFGSGG